jgi:hypothetical protein
LQNKHQSLVVTKILLYCSSCLWDKHCSDDPVDWPQLSFNLIFAGRPRRILTPKGRSLILDKNHPKLPLWDEILLDLFWHVFIIFNHRIFKQTTWKSHPIFYVKCDHADWKIYAFEECKIVFFNLCTDKINVFWLKDNGTFFLYTMHNLNGSMFYIVLGLCT